MNHSDSQGRTYTRPETPAAIGRGRYSIILPPAMPEVEEVRAPMPSPGRYERLTERPGRG
jgi:hypothetical protein